MSDVAVPKALAIPDGSSLAEVADGRVHAVFNAVGREERSLQGAFATPLPLARHMAQGVLVERPVVRILDPGCGVGILAAAVVDALREICPDAEINVTLIEPTADYLQAAKELFVGSGVLLNAVAADFLTWAATAIDKGRNFDIIIANPPYQKLSRRDGGSRATAAARYTSGTTNEYTVSLGLATQLLAPGGRLCYLTPRSYMSGAYFRKFRSELRERLVIDRLHVFEHRNRVFDKDDVLQESVILFAHRGGEQGEVTVTTSASHTDLESASTLRVPAPLLFDGWPGGAWAIISTDDDMQIVHDAQSRNATITSLGLSVATGTIVPFRLREGAALRKTRGAGRIPLLWLQHVTNRAAAHPLAGFRKAQWYQPADDDVILDQPAVLVRRFSAKEDERRAVAAFYDAGGPWVAENHLNVITGDNPALLQGLARYLQQPEVDALVRLWSGNTQLSATELRDLPVPTATELMALNRPQQAGKPTASKPISS